MSSISDADANAAFDLRRTQLIDAMAGSDASRGDAGFNGGRDGASALRPIRSWYVPIKTLVEWCVGLALFVVLCPLIAVLAVLVRATSPGPAFYSQTRLGKDGRRYHIYKLRTMTHNCEATSGAVWATRHDPRVTPVGRILRDTHLDELPQLLNILFGQMGLIGPRPERPEIVPELAREIPSYRQRLGVRPGVTGLAQMLLPADSDLLGVRRKVAHDLHYIQHVSPLMDLRIAACTLCHFFTALGKAGCKWLVGGYGRAVAARWCFLEPDQEELFRN